MTRKRELEPFQEAAVADLVDELARGSNAMLVAPTGAGKTGMRRPSRSAAWRN
jgi:superfamily II DNA or RNA helicase